MTVVLLLLCGVIVGGLTYRRGAEVRENCLQHTTNAYVRIIGQIEGRRSAWFDEDAKSVHIDVTIDKPDFGACMWERRGK